MSLVWARLNLVQMLSYCLTIAQNLPFNCSPVSENGYALIGAQHYMWCWNLETLFRCPQFTKIIVEKTIFKCCSGFELVVRGGTRKCMCEKCPGALRCDSVSGECICPDGYKGPNCSEPCPDGYRGKDCRKKRKTSINTNLVSNSSAESFDCKCQNKGNCSTDNTHCLCSAGWEGERCETRCKEGYYGAKCSLSCPTVNENNVLYISERNSSSCDPETGKYECAEGYTGIFCNETCPIGTYGKNCEGVCKCEKNSTCLPEIEECQCAKIWSGQLCKNIELTTEESEHNTSDITSTTALDSETPKVDTDQYLGFFSKYIWYLIVMSVLLFIFATISINVIVYKKRRKRERKKRERIRRSSIVNDPFGNISGEHVYETIDTYEQGDTYDHLVYFKPHQPLRPQYKIRENFNF